MRQIFKHEMLVDQSMANLVVKILFCTINHHLEPETMKMLARGLNGNEILSTLIYFPLKFTFYKIVSIRNRIQTSMAHGPDSNAVILLQELRVFF